MDAVILAAGKGSRLNGITAPYMKPLLVMNGVPLIVSQVENALQTCSGEIVVVAAPQNAQAINDILTCYPDADPVKIMIQRKPTGPGDALKLASGFFDNDALLVLMADNITPLDDVRRAAEAWAPGVTVVAVREMPREEAKRFTWFHPTHGWHEKVAPPPDCRNLDVWVGPLVIDRRPFCSMLDFSTGDEIGISHVFRKTNTLTISGTSADIGIPEAL